MSEVFLLCDQHQHFFSKTGEWLQSGDSKALYRSPHRDAVINEKVELTVKHPDLRIKIVSAQQSDNGRVTIDGEAPIAKADSAVSEPNALAESSNDDTAQAGETVASNADSNHGSAQRKHV